MLRLLFTTVLALAASAWGQPNDAEKARSLALQKRLLAPCCWNEPVSTHRSEVALEMRAEINRLVAQGKSDREILDLYKSRYGMRILIEPEGQRSFWVHFAPPAVLLAGGVWVVFLIRRWRRRSPQPTAS
jgi:cytochrome c-type biogenesis protein CcmH